MLPVRGPRLPPASIEGQRFWDLPTGSRIAYVRVPAENRAREAPIFLLHGRQDRASKIHNAIDQIEQSEETAGDD